MEMEKELKENEVIVSSTTREGVINYVNQEFCAMSEYSEEELLGKPHNIVRHPDMPKAIFKYVWENLLAQKPIVAYVKNYTKNKDKYYWVKAVIYPIVENGTIVQITSYRTKPSRYAIEQISQVYKTLTDYERYNSLDQSYSMFKEFLEKRNLSYDNFINRLNDDKQISNEKLLNINVNQLKTDHIIFRSRIESLVKQNEKNIEVTSPKCCNFGKQLATFDNEPFSKDSRYAQVKQLHDRVHDEMKVYVDSVNGRDRIISDVHKDIDSLFNVLDDLIDHYR